MMQFNAIQAYMEEDEVIVLQKGMPPQCFTFDGSHLVDPRAPDARLSDIAVAHSTWASATYENETYKTMSTPGSNSVGLSESKAPSPVLAQMLKE